MRVQEILSRGIQETQFKDESYSYTGIRDFKEEKPEILKMGPKAPTQRPRSLASKNNSYS